MSVQCWCTTSVANTADAKTLSLAVDKYNSYILSFKKACNQPCHKNFQFLFVHVLLFFTDNKNLERFQMGKRQS